MSERCLFCGGRILFDLGYACERCGTIREAFSEKRIGAQCPRCSDVRLVLVPLGPAVLQGCARCHGAFVPSIEWDALLDFAEKTTLPPELVNLADLREATVGGPYRDASTTALHAPPNLEDSVKCPTCAEATWRLEFMGVSRVIVDVCRRHGIWLDGGELAAILAARAPKPELPSPGNKNKFVSDVPLSTAAGSEQRSAEDQARAKKAATLSPTSDDADPLFAYWPGRSAESEESTPHKARLPEPSYPRAFDAHHLSLRGAPREPVTEGLGMAITRIVKAIRKR